jgi:hypothetical protein
MFDDETAAVVAAAAMGNDEAITYTLQLHKQHKDTTHIKKAWGRKRNERHKNSSDDVSIEQCSV